MTRARKELVSIINNWGQVQINQDGSFTQTEYDAAGRVTAEIDANGNRLKD